MARKNRDEVDQTEDLGNILDKTWDDFPEEQTLPDGTYLLSVRNIAYMAPREEGQNGKVVAFFIPKEAKEDVDVDALTALGEGYDITENEVSTTIWIERNRDWAQVRSLLNALGVEVEGKTLKEQFKAARKSEVVGYVTTRSYTRGDGSTVVQNVANQFQAA